MRSRVRQIIIQATSFCNIDCKYCYLPHRGRKTRIELDTITSLFEQLLDLDIIDSKVEVRWHAGEPLTVPIDFYRKAFAGISELSGKNHEVHHSLQTNGLMINSAWCDFFKEFDVSVGVSLDGPKTIHDQNRRTYSDGGTFDLTMKGVSKLKENLIDFDVIAVLTSQSLNFPEEIHDFFQEIQPRSVGLNIEETEGENISATFSQNEFRQQLKKFLARLCALSSSSGLVFREFDEIESFIKFGKGTRPNYLISPLSILSIDHLGNFSTFSPELLSYENFVYGNVHTDHIKSLVVNPKFLQHHDAILRGVEQCQKECQYFELCGGGSPSNKLWENKSFDTSETNYCQARIQLPTDVIIEKLETNFSDA